MRARSSSSTLVSAARMPIARTQAEDRPLPMPRRSYPHPDYPQG
jgi:hypothetical protein